MSREPWRPVTREGERVEDLPLNEWVGQALGSASMCWANPGGAGEFDSGRAGWVLEGLMAHLNAVVDGVVAGTALAVAPGSARVLQVVRGVWPLGPLRQEAERLGREFLDAQRAGCVPGTAPVADSCTGGGGEAEISADAGALLLTHGRMVGEGLRMVAELAPREADDLLRLAGMVEAAADRSGEQPGGGS